MRLRPPGPSPGARPPRASWRLLGALAACLAAAPAPAGQVLIRNYNVQDGLCQSQAQTMVQDDQGYLWVGAQHGISRFDGLDFTSYTQNDGLAENGVASSLVDREGVVWFGHDHGGLSRFRDGHWEVVQPTRRSASFAIRDLAEDADGRIWCGEAFGGLLILEHAADRELLYRPEFPLGGVRALHRGRRGMWLGGAEGLFTASLGTEPATGGSRCELEPRGAEVLGGVPVSALWEDPLGRLWIGTEDRGLFVLRTADADGTLRDEVISLSERAGLPAAHVLDVMTDEQGRIWVATMTQGLWRLTPRDRDFHRVERAAYSLEQGLGYHHVTGVVQDTEGNIWCATFGGGICQILDSAFLHLRFTSDPRQNSIWCITQDRRGDYWIGTDGGLVHHRDGEHGRPPETRIYTTRDGLSHDIVRAVAEGPDGELWLASKGGGLMRFDPDGGKVLAAGIAEGLPTDQLVSLHLGGDGHIWIGTVNHGILRLPLPPPGAERLPDFARLEHFPVGGPGSKVSVYSILEDAAGTLWFGARTQGLVRYTPPASRGGEGIFELFGPEQGLADRHVSDISLDDAGLLWVTCLNSYLYTFDGIRFTEIGGPREFHSETLYFVTCDGTRSVLVGTNNGLVKYDRVRRELLPMRQSSEALDNETNIAATCRDDRGHLWLGTIDGVVRYDPESDRINPVPPRVYITRVGLFLEPVPPTGAASFAHDENHFTFDFVGISLEQPEGVTYSYMLDGLDRDWITTRDRRFATYTNLPFGTFTFRVKAANSHGIWCDEPATYTFTIRAPFWRKTWFHVLGVLAVCGLVAGLLRWRTSALARANQRLEARVQERTLELRERGRELELANRALEEALTAAREASHAKAAFLATVSHEIRTPMNGVLGMAELLLDSGLGRDQRECAQAILGSGSALMTMLNDVLDLSKIEAGRLSIARESFDLREQIRETVVLFAPRTREKGLELAYAVDRRLPATVEGDPYRLRQILGNLLGNAVKFTERGEILLHARLDADLGDGRLRLRCELRDSGIGISPADQGRLFEPFCQVEDGMSRTYTGTGLGLAICRQLCQAMEGEIGVESEPGRGSCFWFVITLGWTPAEEAIPELGGEAVRLVVDSAAVRGTLVEALDQSGAEVRGFGGDEEFLADLADDEWILVDEEVLRAGAYRRAQALAALGQRRCERVVVLVPCGQEPDPEVRAILPTAAALNRPLHPHVLASRIMAGVEEDDRDESLSGRFAGTCEGVRVLVVDDNDVNLTVARRLLAKFGCATATATSGPEALTRLREQSFDVILMDCQMPGMDGLETTRRLRRAEKGRHTPVIALTANAMNTDRDQCRNAGMDDYLVKPFHPRQLNAMIRHWTEPETVTV